MKIRYIVSLIFFPLLGCHVYVPTPMSQLSSDQRVRVVLNSTGRQSVETQIGPQVDYVEGAIVSRDSASLTMNARIIKRLTTAEEKYETQRHVTIPLNAIGSVGHITVSKGRTAVAIGASVVGAVLLGNAISGGELLGGGGGSGGSSTTK